MRPEPPPARIRTGLSVPLRFADEYATTAWVMTFEGLIDGREHLAIGLGSRSQASPGDDPDPDPAGPDPQ